MLCPGGAEERKGSLFSLQECGVMWAILFDSISVFPLKGRARANKEKLMDFKNRDGKTPSSPHFRGVRGNREQFQKKSREGAGSTHSAEVVSFRGGPAVPQVVRW